MIAGSFSPSGWSIAREAPAAHHQKISLAETSNTNVVFCKIVSSSVNGYFFCNHVTIFKRPLCAFGTPLGLPVVPDV